MAQSDTRRMRVATVDGLVTLFYDGSKELFNEELYDKCFEEYSYHGDDWEEWPLSDECKQYWRERQSWEQIIVVEGVTVIPEMTFIHCEQIKQVIFASTVVRIESFAFRNCYSLGYIELSIYLEYIGRSAFEYCVSIERVMFSNTVIRIEEYAFKKCSSLISIKLSMEFGICWIRSICRLWFHQCLYSAKMQRSWTWSISM